MGRAGPLPKRSNELMGHRTKAEMAEREVVPVPADIVPVPEADQNWHPIARQWFEALADSGQRQFFEPSDWAVARYVAEIMTKQLELPGLNGATFSAIMKATEALLSTESSRRRLRLELQRQTTAPEESAGVTAINEYKRRITG